MKNWLQKLLGMDVIQCQNNEMIAHQKELIRLMKHHINNDCLPSSKKRKIY